MTKQSSARKLLTAASALVLAFAGTLLVSSPAAAATFTVTTFSELQTAINDANTTPGADIISITAPITVANDLPVISESVEIVGNGHLISGAGFTLFSDDPLLTSNIDITLTNVPVDNALFALTTAHSNVVITNSAFDNASVNIHGSDVTVTVAGSTFDNGPVGTDGLHVTVDATSHVSITDSSADGNGGEGFDISLNGSSSTLSIVRSSADNNGSEGFNLDTHAADTTVTITDSGANDNDDEGFEIDTQGANTTVTITHATVENNGDEGFDITVNGDDSALTIVDSRADGNDDEGFDIHIGGANTAVTMTRSSADGNGHEGFDFELNDGPLTASNLVATGNTERGLELTSTGTINATISDSIFNGSTDGSGISLKPIEGSTITLQRITTNGNVGGTSGGFGGIQINDDGFVGPHSFVTIRDSTSNGNMGPGILIAGDDPGTGATSIEIVVEDSTISNNSWIGGAGILADLNDTSSLKVVNSTVSGNEAAVDGTVFVIGDDAGNASFSLSHSTIVNNTIEQVDEPAGVSLTSVKYSIEHSILAGNTADGAPSDLLLATGIETPVGAINYSLVQTPTGADAIGAVAAGTGNITGVDAMLGPLTNNGGLTLTHLPLDGSPVINAGNPAVSGAPTADQRGQTRIVGTIDMGAVEVQAALAATGVNATPFIIGGGVLLVLGGVIVFFVTRRRHTTR